MVTSARAGEARGPGRLPGALRPWLLALIACDLGLLALRVARYPAFWSMPGAPDYVVGPAVALAAYAAVAAMLPRVTARVAGALAAVRVGTAVGLVGGGIEIADIALESAWSLPQRVVALATGAAMLGLFLTFALAGFAGGRRAGSFWLGMAAAIWSGVVAILIAVTLGFLLLNTSLPVLAHGLSGDPDFVRSGWTDLRAFAIANTFDAGFTHLVEAPAIAAVLGAAGSGSGRLGARRRTDVVA